MTNTHTWPHLAQHPDSLTLSAFREVFLGGWPIMLVRAAARQGAGVAGLLSGNGTWEEAADGENAPETRGHDRAMGCSDVVARGAPRPPPGPRAAAAGERPAHAEGSVRLLLVSGSEVPGHAGFTFGPFYDLAMNGNDQIAFRTTLE